MELIDTPNPNAKKILFDQKDDDISKSLMEWVVLLQYLWGLDFSL